MDFRGFQPQLMQFLQQLGQHNTREWFQARYEDYQRYLVEPARAFVLVMGASLRASLSEDIHAEPKVHGSIFTINRDVRFSKDKSPYKTHVDLWFWQGEGPSRERPGYFLRLQPDGLTLGAGMHAFSDAARERYRRGVLEPASARRLRQVAGDLRAAGYALGGQTYKRVPSGFEPADQDQADWLRYAGLFVETRVQPLPSEVFDARLPELCLAQYRRMAPVQEWLVDVLRE